MLGPESVSETIVNGEKNVPEEVQEMYGVMPRAILDIFNEANRIMKTTSAMIKMEISYYEIYNE
jgi:hypothetical protein